MYSASKMRTEKRRLTVYAVIIIIIIIASGVSSLLLQEKVARSEAITAVGTSGDSLWIIEGNRVLRYSQKGAFMGEFVFNTDFNDVFAQSSVLFLYAHRENMVMAYDYFARYKYSFPVSSASAVYYDNGVFAVIDSKQKKISLLSPVGKKLRDYSLEFEPSGIIWIDDVLYYAPFGKNKLVSVKNNKEIVVKGMPADYSILRGYEFNNELYLIAAQRKGGSYYYSRFFKYSPDNELLHQSNKRYIYPITLSLAHNRIYIGSNLENSIDMYALDGEYRGRFGDDKFINQHSKMYLHRTRYVVIVMIMNTVVVVSFFLSLYVFILSNRLKKKETRYVHE